MVSLSMNELMEYTEWERGKWHEWLLKRGDEILKTSAGPHGDGRFQTVGDVVRHIFSAEKRYVDRLSERAITDTSSIPTGSIEALFQFGQQSRKDLKHLLETFPAQAWDELKEFKILEFFIRASPRKIVAHILMHEIRHWAQLATLFRLNGMTDDFHDFLFSPALGGEFRKERKSA